MDIASCLIIIGGLYGILLFFDTFFKSCAHYPYIQFLKGTGIDIKFFQLRWTTTAFNRTFVRWGSSNKKLLNAWFTCGLYITLLLLPISIIILFIGIGQNVFNSRTNGISSNLIIEPLIPGINLPGSEIGYYSLTLVICSIIHELGHALASVKEDVHLINVGLNIIFILPVAYVNLSSDRLNALNPWRALKILCAGIWHNIVLTLLAFLLYTSIPYTYSPFFKINEGVNVKDIVENSPLKGYRGLEVHDTITMINLCGITNEDSFYDCLQKAYIFKPGYCVSTDIVHNLDESEPLRHTTNGFDCCDRTQTDSICFEYIEKKDGVLEIPPHACLPARTIIEEAKFNCDSNIYCPHNLHCIKPLLDNTTSLLKIERVEKADIIYIGHPSDIIRTVEISSFVPKYKYSHILFPDMIMKILKYIIVFSTGLALVNVIPCLFMDGQYITNGVIQIIFKKHSKHYVRTISMFISLLGTFLLLFHCIYTVWVKILP